MSAAYVQTWCQDAPSKISFLCRKTRGWDRTTGAMDAEPRRHADVYVFALLAHADQTTLDPLDVSHWEFFVLPTATLDARTRSQHSITLPSLQELVAGVQYSGLKSAVQEAAEHQRRSVEQVHQP